MPVIAIDSETGGFKPAENALLSLTLVELDDQILPVPGRVLDLYLLPEPGLTITDDDAKINGYTPEKWAEKGAVSLADGMAQVRAWLPAGAVALAHNARFDKDFVCDAERRTGSPVGLGQHWLCSMTALRGLNDALRLGAPNAKLETLARLCGHWGPEFVRGAHGSLEDALACAAGYRWLLQKSGRLMAKADAVPA